MHLSCSASVQNVAVFNQQRAAPTCYVKFSLFSAKLIISTVWLGTHRFNLIKNVIKTAIQYFLAAILKPFCIRSLNHTLQNRISYTNSKKFMILTNKQNKKCRRPSAYICAVKKNSLVKRCRNMRQ